MVSEASKIVMGTSLSASPRVSVFTLALSAFVLSVGVVLIYVRAVALLTSAVAPVLIGYP